MGETSTPLIEAAVQSLSDNAEMEMAARSLLAGKVTDSKKGGEQAIARWQAIDLRGGRRWSAGLVWLVAVVIFGAMMAVEFREIRCLLSWIGQLTIPTEEPETLRKIAATLNERDRLLLFGDLSMPSKSGQTKALWRSEPDNPIYFAEYARAFISENQKLPPDFLTIAQRIDPENAWFTYLAAAAEVKGTMKGSRGLGKKVAGKFTYASPKTWQIRDQKKFEHALDLLSEARSQPKFNGYCCELRLKRSPLISQKTMQDQVDSFNILANSSVSSSITVREASDVIAAQAMILAETKDLAGYTRLASEADHFLKGLSGEADSSLVDGLVAISVAKVISENLGYTAGKLDLPGEAQRWDAVFSRLKQREDAQTSRKLMVDGKAVAARERMGIIFGGSFEMLARLVEKQPTLRDEELKPVRLLAHEVTSLLSACALVILLLPCLLIQVCHRFCVTVLSRRLARRVGDLLRVSDHMWIVGLGVLLPFCYVMVINRLTPLGGRDLGITGTELLLAQFLGLGLLWLVVPAQIVRWRLSKRAGCCGFGGLSWFGMLAVAGAVAYVPLIGWAMLGGTVESLWQLRIEDLGRLFQITKAMSPLFWLALASAGTALVWLAVTVFLSLLSRPDRQFQQATASRLLVRNYAWMFLVLALAIPGFCVAGQYWYERDTLTKIDPHLAGWSVFESRITVQNRLELLEILNAPPE